MSCVIKKILFVMKNHKIIYKSYNIKKLRGHIGLIWPYYEVLLKFNRFF